MTDPNRRPTQPPTDGPVMGDHPELETDEPQRREPARTRDWLSPLVIAGIVALVVVVIAIILLLIF